MSPRSTSYAVRDRPDTESYAAVRRRANGRSRNSAWKETSARGGLRPHAEVPFPDGVRYGRFRSGSPHYGAIPNVPSSRPSAS